MDQKQVMLVNEYRAQQAKDQRDYKAAIEYAVLARDAAFDAGDEWGSLRLSINIALLQFDLGLIDECIETAEALVGHSSISMYPEGAVRARAILSQALRSKGDNEGALVVAEDAVQALPAQSREARLQLQHSLIPALAEEGDVEAAWAEAQVLGSLIGPESGTKVLGTSYWIIGNAGFLSGRIDEGRRFHEQAATALGSLGDVNLWALFNKASANLRLEADLVEPETLECIERAEVAFSVAEGNESDRLEILLSRSHWEYAVGNYAVAEGSLRNVVAQSIKSFPYISAQAQELLAGCLFKLGRKPEALKTALEAERIYAGSGAGVRRSHVRALIDRIQSSE